MVVITCLFFTLIWSQVLGIPVVRFQEDGKFSKTSYLRASLEPELINYTICLRYSLNFLRSATNTLISYGNEYSPDFFSIALIYGTGTVADFHIECCKTKELYGNECGFFHFDHIDFDQWHHFCFTISFKPMKEGSKNGQLTVQTFMDGYRVNSSVFNKEYTWSPGKAVMSVGQEQDKLGGGYDPAQAFSGRLTDIGIWDRVLDNFEISSLAKCQSDLQGNIIGWTWPLSVNNWEANNVIIEDVDRTSICKSTKSSRLAIFADVTSRENAKFECDVLGGQLPIEESKDAQLPSYKEIRQAFNEMLNISNTPCNVGDIGPETEIKYWTGLYRKQNVYGQYSWYNPYSKKEIREAWLKNLQGRGGHNCGYFFGPDFNIWDCLDPFPCAACHVPMQNRYTIKGLCKDATRLSGDLDHQFFMNGTTDNGLVFRGLFQSLLTRVDKKWRIQSLRHPETFLEVGRLDPPFGTHQWTVGGTKRICEKSAGDKIKLTLSLCYPDQYTCDTGHCIKLSSKCDTQMDCPDKSDEVGCEYVIFGQTYVKELIPRSRETITKIVGKVEDEQALQVYINVSILTFPNINTVGLKFTSDFFLNLRWYDRRLQFYDLNNDTILNSLSQEEKLGVWTPKLVFVNALGPYQTIVDDLTAAVIVKASIPTSTTIQQAVEGEIYEGRENSVVFTREYYHDYNCNFDLRYYPFDTQVCQQIFEVIGTNEKYLKLQNDFEGVEFLGERALVEYEILDERLSLCSTKANISRAIVSIIFKRRMEYHVTNTFLQTLLLVLVGFMTFFFDVDNFTDKIMVVLTTMLVIATIMSSIQSSLPKTSYYKLIDYWLMFSLYIFIVTFMFHTYVGYLCERNKKHSLKGTRPESSLVSSMAGKVRDRMVNSDSTKITQVHVGEMNGMNGGPMVKPNEQVELEKVLAFPRAVNTFGKWAFICSVVGFNIIYWSVSLVKYFSPSPEFGQCV